MLSICTKDQAYGLYLLTPLVIVERLWREHRGAGEPNPWRRALTDRRLILTAVASIAFFLTFDNAIVNFRRLRRSRAFHHRPRQHGIPRLRADAGGAPGAIAQRACA